MSNPINKDLAGESTATVVEQFEIVDHESEVLHGVRVRLYHCVNYDNAGRADDEYYDVDVSSAIGSSDDPHLRPELLGELIAGLEKIQQQWQRRVIAAEVAQ